MALITGAACGLGADQARLFVTEGASVVLADIHADEGKTVAAELGKQAVFCACDVAEASSWMEVTDTARAHFGGFDVLVNNAAIYHRGALLETTLDELHAHYRVNVVGAFLGLQAAANEMRQRGGGSIVNVSSVAGMKAGAGLFAYATTKWALRGMTKAASVDLAPFRIRVNSVAPGLIESPLSETNPAGYNEAIVQQVPLARLGQPRDVASAVLYLASDDSAFVTGIDLVIDGGLAA